MSSRAKRICGGSSVEVTPGDWHTIEVQVVEERIQANFDGKPFLDYRDSVHTTGSIGLHTRAPGLEVRRFEYQPLGSSSLTEQAESSESVQGNNSRTIKTSSKLENDARNLFNGQNLDGWVGDKRFWSVEDGVIVGRQSSPNQIPNNIYLVSDQGFDGDFELEFDCMIEGGNSGVVYRSSRPRSDPHHPFGLQIDIEAALNQFGAAYDEKGMGPVAELGERVTVGSTGTITRKSLPKSPGTQLETKTTDWKHCRVLAEGPLIEHYVDGQLTTQILDRHGRLPQRGLVALQLHRGPAMTARFKNITLVKGRRLVKPVSVSEEATTQAVAPSELAKQIKPGQIWRSSDSKQELLILNRNGEEFRARLKVGNRIIREVQGEVKDERIAWFAKDVHVVKGGQGGDNFGTIRQDSTGVAIDFKWRDPIGSGEFELRNAGQLKPPSGAVRFNGRVFKVITEVVSWNEARDRCTEMGGTLATVESEDVNQFIYGLAIDAGSEAVWLGGSDAAVESQWTWIDGTPMVYSRWGKGQPNNKKSGEHYLALIVNYKMPMFHGTWCDQPMISMEHRTGFVCEWRLQPE